MSESKSEKIAQLQANLSSLLEDAQKNDKGVKAAGVRVRKGLLDVMKVAKELRNEILADSKASVKEEVKPAPATKAKAVKGK
jgi:type II secretory pathway component PulK